MIDPCIRATDKKRPHPVAPNPVILKSCKSCLTPFCAPFTFHPAFWKVYGSTDIKTQIEKGMSPKAIVAGWESGVSSFRGARQGFLLYN